MLIFFDGILFYDVICAPSHSILIFFRKDEIQFYDVISAPFHFILFFFLFSKKRKSIIGRNTFTYRKLVQSDQIMHHVFFEWPLNQRSLSSCSRKNQEHRMISLLAQQSDLLLRSDSL